MTQLLVVHSSPRAAGVSITRRLTAAVVGRFLAQDMSVAVVERDLAAQPPAHVGQEFLEAVRMSDDQRSAEQKDLVAQVDALISEVRAADVVIIGAPMYNSGVTSTLKAWIDWISVPGMSFRYRAEGQVEGLLSGRPLIIVTSRGGDYRPGTIHSGNHADPHVVTAMGLLGFENFHVVAADWQALLPEARRDGLIEAERQIARLPIESMIEYGGPRVAHG